MEAKYSFRELNFKRIPLWTRFRLWFVKPIYSTDWASDETECIQISKWLNGRLYIVGQIIRHHENKSP